MIASFLAANGTVFRMLLGISTLILSACSAERPPPEGAVNLNTLLALERGTSLDNVCSALRMSGKHECSALIDKTRYLFIYFAFEQPHVGFYLIFTNEHLKAVVDPPKPEFEKVPYKDTVREIPKPVDPEKRIKIVLDSADLSQEEVKLRIRQAMPKSASSLNMLPAFLIASPLFLARSGEIEGDYRTNAELAKKFDPVKLAVGAELGDVERAFGKPYRVIRDSEERVVQVYGSPVSLRINPSYRFSWVTVVLENGKVVRILSNHFFDQRLLQSQME